MLPITSLDHRLSLVSPAFILVCSITTIYPHTSPSSCCFHQLTQPGPAHVSFHHGALSLPTSALHASASPQGKCHTHCPLPQCTRDGTLCFRIPVRLLLTAVQSLTHTRYQNHHSAKSVIHKHSLTPLYLYPGYTEC